MTTKFITAIQKFAKKHSAAAFVCLSKCGFASILLIVDIVVLFLALLIDAVFIINKLGPMASMVISLIRLTRNDYDGSDAANNGKLRAALFIFYSLALAHRVCFYCWFLLQHILEKLSKSACTKWGLDKDYGGRILLLQYVRETKTKCANDLLLPDGWNLVRYAVGLLKSVSRHDHLNGLRLLDAFVVKKRPSIRLEVLSSSKSIQNLIKMLEWNGSETEDQEMRERAARIVADVATGALHLTQIPGALQCISSLLEASPLRQHCQEDEKRGAQKQNEEKEEEKEVDAIKALLQTMKNMGITFEGMHEQSPFKPKGTKELIHQGLQILERLSYDDQNCREVCYDQRLLTKITAPITSADFLDIDYDNSWVDILSILLRLVMRLISAPGEASTGLCHEILISNHAVHNLQGILDGQIKHSLQLQENAMDILTQISIGASVVMTENLFKRLYHIFLGNSGMSELRPKAGEALVKLLSAQSASGQLSVIEIFCKSISTEEICKSKSTDALDVKTYGTIVDKLTDILVKDKECQISAATILEHLCYRFIGSYELSDKDVVKLLILILGLILSDKTERNEGTISEARESNNSEKHNDEESKPPKTAGPNMSSVEKNDEQRKHLAALLSILVVICNKLVDADLFSYVTVNEALVKKLKKIIEENNKNTVDCLNIVKLACQVVIGIIRLKPSCLKDFNENNFDAVLSTALKNMSDIDNCMLFAVNDREITKPTRTLCSLVKEAQGLLRNAQETGNSST